jgi:RHS repeat-associated protein
MIGFLLTFGSVASSQEPDLDYTYDMFYPKYAKGFQPTAYDPGGFDNVNLYNGALTLAIPLGPPLRPGADLSWQMSLYYSTSFWSDDRRDANSPTGADEQCWRFQGRGYVQGDRHAGIGWTLKAPHIYLQQIKHTDSDEYDYYVAAVITPDGARHQLRPCLEGWDCRNGDSHVVDVDGELREYWYGTDDSSWRIYRVIASAGDQLTNLAATTSFVGEAGGMRYTFDYRHLLDQIGENLQTDTDFMAEARGWYCTSIESQRWTGPSVTFSYTANANGSPYLSGVTGKDHNGVTSGSIDVVLNTTEPRRVTRISFKDAKGAIMVTYSLVYDPGQFTLPIREDIEKPGCNLSSTPQPPTQTEVFKYLSQLKLQEPTAVPNVYTDLLTWDFGTWYSCDPDGHITQLILPNGTTAEYQHKKWYFAYQKFCVGANIIAINTHDSLAPVTDDCRGHWRADPRWGVSDRKVVDADGHLLEWTEYLRSGINDEYLGGIGAEPINLYERPFDLANVNQTNSSGDPLVPAIGDEAHFYTGFAQTVVRRHLVVDKAPGATSADDLATLATSYVIDLPSARFDDTMYIFSNGRFIYDLDKDGVVDREPWGSLPLDGQPLEVRFYRGSSVNSDGTYKWWESLTDHPRLLRRKLLRYTLDRETDLPLDGSTPSRPCTGEQGGYSQYCASRSDHARARSSVTWYRDAGLYSGSEQWYEADHECYSSSECVRDWKTELGFTLGISSPLISDNLVLGASSSDYSSAEPAGADLGLRTSYTYTKAFLNGDYWLPSLLGETVTKLVSPASFSRSTFAYNADGTLWQGRQHLRETGSDTEDVVTVNSYHQTGSAFALGRLKEVAITKSGSTTDATGYEYIANGSDPYGIDYQLRQWKLCRTPVQSLADYATVEGESSVNACPGWASAPATFGSVGGELVLDQRIDPAWRRVTRLVDANGDGISAITYDSLGRVTNLTPTDAGKAESWVTYSNDLRTTKVFVEDPDAPALSGSQSPPFAVGDRPNLVAMYVFDGLGRISHASRRRELTTATMTHTDSSFRDKTFFYDGAGTQWSVSHWLTSPACAPGSLNGSTSSEIVARADPFGRVERAVASDGGVSLKSYQGDAYKISLVNDPARGPLSHTVVREDALGNKVEVWEDKVAPTTATDPPPLPDSANLADPAQYVRTRYSYDAGQRMTRVEVRGLDKNGSAHTQLRLFSYDPLGNLTLEQFPEHGTGNGSISYSSFDALGRPRRVNLGADEIIDTYYDAAGRFNERWSKVADSWYKVGTVTYGSSTATNSIGKPVTEIRYNLVRATGDSCPSGCVDSGSIVVTHRYFYEDSQGMLSRKDTEVSFGGEDATGGQHIFKTLYAYDLWKNLSRIVYPEPLMLSCNYHPEVELSWYAVGLAGIDEVGGAPLLESPQYDHATGIMTGWSTPAGTYPITSAEKVNHSVTVDGTRPRVRRITARSPVGYTFFDTGNYAFDAAGNITSIGSWSYGSDDLSRLVATTSLSYGSRSYSYDDHGNLYRLGSSWISLDPATNRLNSTGIVYDNRGNLTAEPTAAGWTRRMRYDNENQLVAAWAEGSGAPGDRYGFAYDLGGERVLRYRAANGLVQEASFYLRDESGNELTELQWVPQTYGSGSEAEGIWFRIADRLYLDRRPILILGRDPQGNGTYTTLANDPIDSVRAEVYNAENNDSITMDYWPYGEIINHSSNMMSKHLFTGHEREITGAGESALMGLDYMHARYYSHSLGRFISIDPDKRNELGSQSWNAYLYVDGNPIRFIDPSGREKIAPGLLDLYSVVFERVPVWSPSFARMHGGYIGESAVKTASAIGGTRVAAIAIGNQIFLSKSLHEGIQDYNTYSIAMLGHELTHTAQWCLQPEFMIHYILEEIFHEENNLELVAGLYFSMITYIMEDEDLSSKIKKGNRLSEADKERVRQLIREWILQWIEKETKWQELQRKEKEREEKAKQQQEAPK